MTKKIQPLLSVICYLTLVACSPQQQSYITPVHPHAAVVLQDATMQAADETLLPLKRWLPKGKPRAVIIALHGFNDYSNAFQGTGMFFKAHGIATVAYDQRGFGKAPQTGIWGNEKNFTSDLAACVKQVSRRWPHVPVYVLGESMGGAVVVAALSDPDFPKVRGAIVSSPALWGAETMNPLFHSSLWLAAHLWPSYTLSGSELHIMASNNIAMLQRLSADPLVIKKTRLDTMYGIMELMDSAYNDVPNVKTPVLMLYGGKDQVIPPEPIEASLPRFTAPVTFAYYPDGYHLLERDLQGEIVMQDMLSWIETPQKPLPSGAEK